MLKRLMFNMVILTISIGLIFGATMAYFTGGAPIDDTLFTFGSLKVEVTKASDETSDWIPIEGSNIKKAQWLFKNNGSKKAYIRAKVDAIWLGKTYEEVLGKRESAWGGIIDNEKVIRIGNGQGNNSRYVIIETISSPQIIPLVAGNDNKPVGSIVIDTIDGKVRVKYTMNEGWKMSESHLHIQNEASRFPHNPGGFNFKTNPHRPWVEDEFIYTVAGLSLDKPLLVAAHAVVHPYTISSGDECEIPDIYTTRILTSPNWELRGEYYYYTERVLPGESVALSFDIILNSIDESIRGGKYLIDLEGYAIQVTNYAAYYEWDTDLYGIPTH